MAPQAGVVIVGGQAQCQRCTPGAGTENGYAVIVHGVAMFVRVVTMVAASLLEIAGEMVTHQAFRSGRWPAEVFLHTGH